MNESKTQVVTIDYTVKNSDGEILDTTEGGEPMAFLEGTQSILPHLEQVLAEKKEGEEIQVVLSPEQAYGVRRDDLVIDVPRDSFPQDIELTPGSQYQFQSPEGVGLLTVLSVHEDQVRIDRNHPLAGVELHFSAAVVSRREATEQELEHGHAHGPGGEPH